MKYFFFPFLCLLTCDFEFRRWKVFPSKLCLKLLDQTEILLFQTSVDSLSVYTHMYLIISENLNWWNYFLDLNNRSLVNTSTWNFGLTLNKIALKKPSYSWCHGIPENNFFIIWQLTCSWYVFTNSESTNPRIFFATFFFFSFKTR